VIRLCLFIIIFLAVFVSVRANPENHIPVFREYSSIVRIGNNWSTDRLFLKYEKALRINQSTSYWLAVQQGRQAGFDQLKNLSLNASVEEHWIFLPEENLWVEISFNETAGSTEIDFNFLKDYIAKYEKIEVYHVHLRNYLKSFNRKESASISETWLSVPSFEDIAIMVYFSSCFYKLHPDGTIAWKICSPIGMTDYSLSGKGIIHYMDIGKDSFMLSYLYPSVTKAVNPESISTFDVSRPHRIQNLMEWVNARGKGLINVRFMNYYN
jgi:hypothetical protein